MHAPGPNTEGNHDFKDGLHINSEQREKRNKEVSKNDYDSHPKPGAPLTHNIPEGFLRHVRIPNDEVLSKMNVSVKNGESKNKRTKKVILMVVEHVRQDTLAVKNHRDQIYGRQGH